MTLIDEHDDHIEPDGEDTGRRALFAKGAAAAAAAAVAGLAFGKQASAANGDNLIIGSALNLGTATTQLGGGSTLRVNDGFSSGRNAPALGGNKLASIYGTQAGSNRVGVFGEATGSSSGWGVLGYNTSSSGSGVAGINIGEGGVGVYGEHYDTSTSGTGVYGRSRFGTGVVGAGTVADFHAGGSGRVRLAIAGVSTPPASAGTQGTIARDAAGNLWYAVATNSWRKVAGSDTSGAFHAITPTRVYDSRWADGKILANANKVVSVANGRDLNSGAVSVANLVPAGATAVVGNLTIAGTNAGAGALAVTPGDAATFTASTINWSGAGVLLANGFTCKLDASRQLKVFCLGTGTNFIIDIAGYYL